MSAFELVVFDIDDTLYLERDYVRSGFLAVEREQSGRVPVGFADRAWELFEGGRRGDIFDAALDGVETDPALVAALVAAYRDHTPDIVLLADAADALSRARSNAWVGIVTDGPLASQRAKAAALDLAGHAREVVFTEALGSEFRKPHPRAFRELERASGVSGRKAVYVADNPAKDFAGPRSLGWTTIRVRRPMSLHERVDSGSDVDDEVTDLTSLLVPTRRAGSRGAG